MSAADHGETDRAMSTLQAKVLRLVAEVARLEARVDALESESSPDESVPVDFDMPSESERLAMVKRLRAASLAGIEANALDRNRAGRTYRKESGG